MKSVVFDPSDQVVRAQPERSWRDSYAWTTFKQVLQNPQGLFAVSGLIVLILLAAFAELIAWHDPNAQNAAARFLSPSLDHPFGTDQLRRDLFARTLVGLRSALLIALLSVGLGGAIGTMLGFFAGYVGRWVDLVLMRIVDALLAFPGLLTAMAIITILGPGLRNVGIAIAFFAVPSFARLARAQMLSEMRRDYVLAANVLGAGPMRIIFRHVSMNAIPPLLTQLALAMTAAVLLSAALSFLGLGERPPNASLGGLINDSKVHLRDAWWYAVFPGVTLAFLLLCLNFLADAINEAMNPYTRRR